MTYVLTEFPTHVEKTANIKKENKWWKINSQSIYNGSIQKFTRAIVINNMHKYILAELVNQPMHKINTSVQLILRIYIPINYGDIRRRNNGIISWKKPAPSYIPSADEDNISWIWNKCIKDCLTKLKVWEDDNMKYCIGTDSAVVFIDDIIERKIEISFRQI